MHQAGILRARGDCSVSTPAPMTLAFTHSSRRLKACTSAPYRLLHTGCTHAARGSAASIAPTPGLLERNLQLLRVRSPAAARAIAAAPVGQSADEPASAASFSFFRAADGELTATMRSGETLRSVCSAVAPVQEAARWADAIEIISAAAIVVRGFGCGHHVTALAQRLGQLGSIFVFEPDVCLLREVFSRIDVTTMLRSSFVVLLTDPRDHSAMAVGVEGLEGTLAAGTRMVTHPPSVARLRELDAADEFGSSFANVIRGIRTTIVTTLVQADVTARNCIQNIVNYTACPGIDDLAGTCKGFPAVVVSAGPSLSRTIAELEQPGVRDRVVIIAVQTVLRTLLDRGIRPHFVTSIDYHEISARFYEGLTPTSVQDVTLVADPKCNPIVPASFPGQVRFCGDDVADRIAGPAFARARGRLPPGATVAHTAYYLARFLGCDPVMLIGQDLGFTDGQYYAAGATIHNVWAAELNEFNTLEMLEWQRIVRMRSMLRRVVDHRSRPMYSDEQMCTYLLQFERDFGKDAAAGRTTIDATQGGVKKAHTTAMPFAAALEQYATRQLPPAFHAARQMAHVQPVGGNSQAVISRLQSLYQSTIEIESCSTQASSLLAEMLEHHDDQDRVNGLIQRVQRLATHAAVSPAYWLTQFINQAGQLNRFRSDRKLEFTSSLSELERQRGQIERDLQNVRWMGEVTAHLRTLVVDGLATARGQPPVTRDPSLPDVKAASPTGATHAPLNPAQPCPHPGIAFFIPVLVREDLPSLQKLIDRLDTPPPTHADRWPRLGWIFLPDDDAQLIQAVQLLLSKRGTNLPDWRIQAVAAHTLHTRARRVAGARGWSRHSWRGGVANLTCYDECYFPAVYAPVVHEHKLTGIALLSPRWRWADKALIGEIIGRFADRPLAHGLSFSQAAPGLGTCVVSAKVIAESACVAGPHATIGGLLAYIPIAPQADPISKPLCVGVDPRVRDALLAADPEVLPPALCRRLDALHEPNGIQVSEIISAAARAHWGTGPGFAQTVTVHASNATTPSQLGTAVAAACLGHHNLAVTIIAPPGNYQSLVTAARASGASFVHLRIDLTTSAADCSSVMHELDEAAEIDCDVISVSLVADSPTTYAMLTGRGDFHATRAALERLVLAERATEGPLGHGCGLPARWIVPRLERRDAIYGQLEHLYDRLLLACGTAIIDPRSDGPPPLPLDDPPQSIRPLPLPPLAQWRQDNLHQIIHLHASAAKMLRVAG